MSHLRRATATAALGLALALAWPATTPKAQDSPLMLAMQDELKRSMSELRIDGQPAPYYIEYEIDDVASMRVVTRLGGVVDNLHDRSRTLRVQVRVGDYSFDSSRFISADRGGGLVANLNDVTAPLDDNYDVIRRQIWLTTDAAYKRAINVFAKKKATFQNRAATDNLPDFSRERPVVTELPILAPTTPGREWLDRAQRLSALFLTRRGLDSSDVWVSETRGTSYYLNSEGFRAVVPISSAYLRMYAEATAADGATVRDVYSTVAGRLEDLPPMSELSAHATEVADRTHASKTAPLGEEFTGPVLVEGQASAELLRQSFAPLLLARRPPDGENGFGRGGAGQVTPFLSRIGLRVMTDSFAVSDTPSLKEFGGHAVAGAYLIDDEAVPARDVSLVEKGRLVTLLTSRTPQKNLPASNGHGRSGTVQPGVLQVRSTQAIPAAELKAKYLELLKIQDKPYGYIVRALAAPGDIPGGAGPGGPVMLAVVKVTPDGKEEAVRGLRFGAIPSTAFRDILESSREQVLYNYRIDAGTPASIIAPSLIFEELEIQRTREIVQKPPVVPSPVGE